MKASVRLRFTLAKPDGPALERTFAFDTGVNVASVTVPKHAKMVQVQSVVVEQDGKTVDFSPRTAYFDEYRASNILPLCVYGSYVTIVFPAGNME